MAVADGTGVTGIQGSGPGRPSSTSRRLPRIRGHVAIGHAATPLRARRPGKTPSRSCGNTAEGSGDRARGITATWSTPPSWRAAPREAGPIGDSGAPTAATALLCHRRLLPRAPPTCLSQAAALDLLPTLRGAFSSVHGRGHPVRGARPYGVWPLVMGRWNAAGWWPARPPPWTSSAPPSSATSNPASRSPSTPHGRVPALRDPRPEGLPFRVRVPGPPRHTISGRPCTDPGRHRPHAGPEHPADADLVIGVPESGTPAAIGYAAESAIPFGQGLVQERPRRPHLHPAVAAHPPAGHPAQAQPVAGNYPRQAARPSTTPSCGATPSAPIVRMRASPARSRCTCASPPPPVKWPRFYGIDFATPAELEPGSRGEVDAVEARPPHGRRRHAHVHLDSARLAQHPHQGALGVAATIESSTTISRLPRITSLSGLSLSRMPNWRMVCDGWMQARPT